jgi:uncharacterized repeat protein (TIGR02543 family)
MSYIGLFTLCQVSFMAFGAYSSAILTTNFGWAFTGWTGDLVSNDNPTSVIMNSNKSLTAQYSQITHTVTFDLGSHGTWTGGGALTQSVAHGAAAVAPEFTVEAGWSFTGWDTDFDLVRW